MPPKLSCVADVHLFYVSFNSGVFWHTMPIELNTALPWLGQKSGATHNAPLSIIFRGLYLWGETNSGWLIRKMSGWLPASKGTENRIGAWLYKTMSVRLMTFTEGGNMQKGGKLCQLSWWKTLLRGERTLPTFQDVNALFVGRVGVGVVRWCEHPSIDVADPRATVVLVRTLAAMLAWGILKERGRKQMNRWVIESRDQWGNDWKPERVEKAGKEKRALRQETKKRTHLSDDSRNNSSFFHTA